MALYFRPRPDSSFFDSYHQPEAPPSEYPAFMIVSSLRASSLMKPLYTIQIVGMYARASAGYPLTVTANQCLDGGCSMEHPNAVYLRNFTVQSTIENQAFTIVKKPFIRLK